MQAVVYIKLRAEFTETKAASGLELVVPMPPEVQRLACDHATEVCYSPSPHPTLHGLLPILHATIYQPDSPK